MTTLAVEFTTSRMLQSVYGTSNIVWANVIGLVLLFLTVGYFLGGWLADRYPDTRLFYGLVSLAGICSVFFLLLASAILRSAATALAAVNLGAIVSSLAGVIIALGIPVILLGCISPFAIRLGVRNVGEAGRISGRIYALSTLGSLLGTYLPVLLVIPLAGTKLTAVVFGVVLIIVGILGLWRSNRRVSMGVSLFAVLLVPLTLVLFRGGIKEYPGQIFETESAYNYVQVVRQADCNYLLLNEGQAYHSFYCDDSRVPRISVWSIMLAAPYFNENLKEFPINRLAVVGLAAGTIPKQFTQTYGMISIDGIELDPAIVEVGQEHFKLDEPNINIIVGDGRYELNRLEGNYDVITLDAYKVPYIPWHLTTQEFFTEVDDQLNDNGILAVNVGRVPNDRRLVEALTGTLLTVFPSVHTIDVPGSLNSILVATVQPTTAQNLRENVKRLDLNTDPLLVAALRTAEDNLVPTASSDLVFTDERAPVETLIDSIVIRYLIDEGPEGLPGIGG